MSMLKYLEFLIVKYSILNGMLEIFRYIIQLHLRVKEDIVKHLQSGVSDKEMFVVSILHTLLLKTRFYKLSGKH